jgi:hypothetical protein
VIRSHPYRAGTASCRHTCKLETRIAEIDDAIAVPADLRNTWSRPGGEPGMPKTGPLVSAR